MTNLDRIFKKQRCHFTDKGLYSQNFCFVRDHKVSWALKNWCSQIVVLEKTLESPLDCKEIKQVNPKGDQPWIFTGKTVAEAEAPVLWPPDAKSWLIGKVPAAGKNWRGKEKQAAENEMVR